MEYQKDEEDSFKTAVKLHSVLSSAISWVTDTYPDKFGQNIKPSIRDKFKVYCIEKKIDMSELLEKLIEKEVNRK